MDTAETVTASPLRRAVEEVFGVIRPALRRDGQDVAILGVDDTTGVVTVRVLGGCGAACPGAADATGCGGSAVALTAGIERILRDRVAGVTAVVDPGCAPTGPADS